jgi:hypothetical protein
MIRIAKPGGSEESGVDFSYSYNIRTDNKNGRTLKGLCANVGMVMSDIGGDYYPDFELFRTYYGQSDYADHWITAAINKNATNFKSG